MPASPQDTKVTPGANAGNVHGHAAKPEVKPEMKPEMMPEVKPEVKPEAAEAAEKKERKRIDVSVVSAALLEESFDSFEEDETVMVLSNRERSETQIAVDAKVKAAHEAWIAAGKPDNMKDSLAAKLPADVKEKLGVKGVVQRFFVSPETVDAYKTLLDNSGRFLGLQVKKYPVQKDSRTGRNMLPFVVKDRRDYKSRAAKTDDKSAVISSVTPEKSK